jgi:hypothetical protein
VALEDTAAQVSVPRGHSFPSRGIGMFVGAFEFEEDGRSYRCCVEGERSSRAGAWWWFDVSGDPQRYAPFHPEPGDTKNSVRERIVGYYNALLVRRAMPPQPRYGQGRRPSQPIALNTTSEQPVAEATNVPGEPAQNGDAGDEL